MIEIRTAIRTAEELLKSNGLHCPTARYRCYQITPEVLTEAFALVLESVSSVEDDIYQEVYDVIRRVLQQQLDTPEPGTTKTPLRSKRILAVV